MQEICTIMCDERDCRIKLILAQRDKKFTDKIDKALEFFTGSIQVHGSTPPSVTHKSSDIHLRMANLEESMAELS